MHEICKPGKMYLAHKPVDQYAQNVYGNFFGKVFSSSDFQNVLMSVRITVGNWMRMLLNLFG